MIPALHFIARGRNDLGLRARILERLARAHHFGLLEAFRHENRDAFAIQRHKRMSPFPVLRKLKTTAADR